MATKSAESSVHRQRSIAAQAKMGVASIPKKRGRPTIYTKVLGETICQRLSNGETLSAIVKDIGIHQDDIYKWVNRHADFAESYKIAKEHQSVSLLNELLDDSKGLENDRALAVRVRADIVRWYASKVNPGTFGDTKKLELKAEITHTHVHNLAPAQRRRIAEAWMLSQQGDDGLVIEGETVPELESVGVQTVADEGESRVVPRRKRAALPAKTAVDPDSGGRWTKRGRE